MSELKLDLTKALLLPQKQVMVDMFCDVGSLMQVLEGHDPGFLQANGAPEYYMEHVRRANERMRMILSELNIDPEAEFIGTKECREVFIRLCKKCLEILEVNNAGPEAPPTPGGGRGP